VTHKEKIVQFINYLSGHLDEIIDELQEIPGNSAISKGDVYDAVDALSHLVPDDQGVD
jgi:hypothetical protein